MRVVKNICFLIFFVIIFFFSITGFTTFLQNKNKPKIVGVISDYSLNKKNEHNYSFQPVHIIREQYINTLSKICKNYNVSFILIPVDNNQIENFSKIVDGVIFTGGADVDAKYYNQEKHPKSDDDIVERTEFEISFLKKILKQQKPILSICRGTQLINIALGGDMVQDIPSYIETKINHSAVKNGVGYLDEIHTVKTNDNSLIRKITNKQEFWVNSNHHQAINKLGKNIIVSAVSPTDNIVEAIEFKDYKNFFLGLQWHPEFANTEEDKDILEAFCKSL